jgi:hypothetical protein
VGDPTHQQHDFEPGIARTGLFWTIRIPRSAVSYDARTGRARFHARNVRVKDHHDILSAIQGGGPRPIPSQVSFDVRWHGRGQHRKIRDKKFGFEGQYITGPATVSFTAKRDGSDVVYRSVATGQYNPTVKQMGAGSPAVGRERNGIFFQ